MSLAFWCPTNKNLPPLMKFKSSNGAGSGLEIKCFLNVKLKEGAIFKVGKLLVVLSRRFAVWKSFFVLH